MSDQIEQRPMPMGGNAAPVETCPECGKPEIEHDVIEAMREALDVDFQDITPEQHALVIVGNMYIRMRRLVKIKYEEIGVANGLYVQYKRDFERLEDQLKQNREYVTTLQQMNAILKVDEQKLIRQIEQLVTHIHIDHKGNCTGCNEINVKELLESTRNIYC